MIYLSLGITILLVFVFIYVELTKKPHLSMLLKGLASLGFISIFVFVLRDWYITGGFIVIHFTLYTLITVAAFIFLGLTSGLAGDLYLAIRPMQQDVDKSVINGGIMLFSIGHIFYFIGLLQIERFSFLSLVFGIIMTGVIYLGSDLLGFKMGKAKIPSLIYTFILFGLVGQSLGYAMETHFQTFSLIFLIGASLFAISDLILAPIYFKGDNKKILVILNYVAYYGAQILIALSFGYLR